MKLFGAMTSWMTLSVVLTFVPASAQSLQTFTVEPLPQPAPRAFVQVVSDSRSFIGVGAREIDSERAKALRLKEEYGVEITRVDEDSPAEHGGVKPGDIVIAFNGQRVEGTEQLIRFVRETPPGRTVKLTIVRESTTQTVNIMVGGRQSQAPGEWNFNMNMPDMNVTIPDMPTARMSWRNVTLGVEAESLGETQLAAYFGVKDGVLVRSVYKGTAAEKAGLKAGDVLLKVDSEAVSTPREITNALHSARGAGKKTVGVVAMRERKEISLSVAVQDTVGSSSRQRRATAVANEQE